MGKEGRPDGLQLPSCSIKTGRGKTELGTMGMWLQEHRRPSASLVPTEVPLSPPENLYKEEIYPKDITKWNSNDLMDKMENPEPEDPQGNQP